MCSVVCQPALSRADLQLLASVVSRGSEVLHGFSVQYIDLYITVHIERRTIVMFGVEVVQIDIRQDTHLICVRCRRSGADHTSVSRN